MPDLDLDAIKARAAYFADRTDADLHQLVGVDVPALLAEVERLRSQLTAAVRVACNVGPDAAPEQSVEPLPTPDPTDAIYVFQFSTRVFNCLWRNGIRTVGDLVACDENDLYDLRNSGVKSVAEVHTALATRGLKLRNVFAPRPVEQGKEAKADA